MKHLRWVVVAKVASSPAATRTDSCGDMEQVELMDLILVSEHETKQAASEAADKRRAARDGWVYIVRPRYQYDSAVQSRSRRAA
jgi:phosphopantetheine adenylyltransferase